MSTLDSYVGLRDLVQGRVAQAAGAVELHEALSQDEFCGAATDELPAIPATTRGSGWRP